MHHTSGESCPNPSAQIASASLRCAKKHTSVGFGDFRSTASGNLHRNCDACRLKSWEIWALRGAIFAVVVAFGRGEDAGTRSPFLPPNAPASAAQAAAASPNGLEFHGVMVSPSGTEYNIYDPTKKSSYWVPANGTAGGLTVKGGDAANNTVTVEMGGQVQTLVMKDTKVQAGMAGPMPGIAPVSGVVLHPTPEDEQRRLQAVAEEVRRRRLLREQAAGQGPGGAQPGQPGFSLPNIQRR
jgi:hypothetical protein